MTGLTSYRRKGVAPLSMEITARIRCMRAIDCTPLLLTAFVNGTVKLWNLEQGECVRDLEGFHDGVLCLDVYRATASDFREATIFGVGGGGDYTAKVDTFLHDIRSATKARADMEPRDRRD